MVYPVVHQFDRFGELQRDLNRRMPLDPQLLVSNSTTVARAPGNRDVSLRDTHKQDALPLTRS